MVLSAFAGPARRRLAQRFPQPLIDAGLPARTTGSESRNNIAIDPQRDGFFRHRAEWWAPAPDQFAADAQIGPRQCLIGDLGQIIVRLGQRTLRGTGA